MEWIRCGGGFIEADVIRWTESVWQKSRRKGGRDTRIGDRTVTAEVVGEDGEWVELLVLDCVVTDEATAQPLALLAKESEVRRRRQTIEKGNPHRALWRDEAARAALIRPRREDDDFAPSPD